MLHDPATTKIVGRLGSYGLSVMAISRPEWLSLALIFSNATRVRSRPADAIRQASAGGAAKAPTSRWTDHLGIASEQISQRGLKSGLANKTAIRVMLNS